MDDYGNIFVVKEWMSLTEATRLLTELTTRGHKQTYNLEAMS